MKKPEIVYGSPFAIDWTDKNEVVAYAIKLGSGQTVYKRHDRSNYNITFTDEYYKRPDNRPEWVVYET